MFIKVVNFFNKMSVNKPIRKTFLPLAIPDIGREERREILDTLNSNWLSMGPKTKLFEEKVKEYVNAKEAIAVSSCTAALHTALTALNIGSNDEVITTPLTFVSTGNAIIYRDAKPVLVDVKRNTFNIDPKEIEKKINSKTKAIIPVHLYGQPCDMKGISEIAERYGLKVIEDAAHAIGAEYEHKKIGSISDFTCFSFYATKNLTTGDGGMLTTNDKKLAETARILSFHGIDKDVWKRYSSKGAIGWKLKYIGYKYNMNDLQASIGLHQLKKLDYYIKNRQKLSKTYQECLENVDCISYPEEKSNIKHARHIFAILLDLDKLKISRYEFASKLKKENIGTGIHFPTMHLQPYYMKYFGYKPKDLPNATFISKRVLSLPLFNSMEEDDVQDVITAIKKVIALYKK